MREIIAELRSKPSVSVPIAGKALGDLSKNASYDAANKGTLDVPVLKVGGKLRVPSIAVLRKLGLAEETPTAAYPTAPPRAGVGDAHERMKSSRRRDMAFA
jgi:hypothetical protein